MPAPLADNLIVQPDEVIGGKYCVERILGAGGMGIVVVARHVDLRTRFALKIMRPEAARDADSVERFLREARAAVQLKGEHCVQVLDVGKLENGSPFMVMEFLVGHDLGEIIARDGARSPAEAVDYILQACAGVAEAHARGIVHRDLKPQNMFVTTSTDGKPLLKVLDFGLAKSLRTTKEVRALTQTTAVMGSPVYMSPEQMRASREVDTRTDTWSLGVCLHELLTGKPPFDGATFPELCSMVLKEQPAPLPSDIPRKLVKIVGRCLEKKPERRFADLGELAFALEEFAPARGAAAKIRAVLDAPHEDLDSIRPPRPVDRDAETQSAASLDTAKRAHAARARRGPAIAGGALLLATVAAALLARPLAHTVAASPAPSLVSALASEGSPPDLAPVPIDAAVAESVASAPVATVSPLVPAPTRRTRHAGAPRPSPAAPSPPPAPPPAAAPVLKPKTNEF